jgi:FkbM family methyltransferase
MNLQARLRGVAHTAMRGVVLRRRLPASVGGATVFLAPESQLKHLRPGVAGFDAALIAWAKRFTPPGGTVWDIGANCGVFALAAAGLGAEVLAVEPDPCLSALLLRARAANQHLKLDVLTAAVADQTGVATLVISSGGRAGNALSSFAGSYIPFGRGEAQVLVPTLRLDDLLAVSTPSLVKIDVEGAEILALRGAARLLAEVRPVLLVEVGSEVWDEARGIFGRARYRLFDPDEPEREVSEPLFNVLARPDDLPAG